MYICNTYTQINYYNTSREIDEGERTAIIDLDAAARLQNGVVKSYYSIRNSTKSAKYVSIRGCK